MEEKSKVFDMFPQQNFADMLKSIAWRDGKLATRLRVFAAVHRLECAPIWLSVAFAQAIDHVQTGAIWVDHTGCLHIEGGAATLERIVDTYYDLTGQS